MMKRPTFCCPRCRSLLPGRERVSCTRCGYGLSLEEGVWRNEALALPAGFPPERRDHLSEIEKAHFWFGPRDRLLYLLAKRLFSSRGEALELGCGSGRLLKNWDRLFDLVTGVESYGASLDEAAAARSGAVLVQADVAALPFAAGQFDILLAFDVLEHVEADDMLREARRVAREGAGLLLSVPAFQGLWSYADEVAGHRCRYDLRRLEEELGRQQWRLVGHTYYQFALFPLLWLSRRVLGRQGSSVERMPGPVLSRMLGAINSLEVQLSSDLPLPFGSSLIAWAEADSTI